MDAFDHDVLRLPEHLRVLRQTLQDHPDRVAAPGHQVAEHESLRRRAVDRRCQCREVVAANDHRLVGEDVHAGVERHPDALDLAAVAAREDRNRTGRLLAKALEKIRPGMDAEPPIGPSRRVVAGDAAEIVGQLRAERGVDMGLRRDIRVAPLLYQRRMEMAGIDDDETGRRHRAQAAWRSAVRIATGYAYSIASPARRTGMPSRSSAAEPRNIATIFSSSPGFGNERASRFVTVSRNS